MKYLLEVAVISIILFIWEVGLCYLINNKRGKINDL